MQGPKSKFANGKWQFGNLDKYWTFEGLRNIRPMATRDTFDCARVSCASIAVTAKSRWSIHGQPWLCGGVFFFFRQRSKMEYELKLPRNFDVRLRFQSGNSSWKNKQKNKNGNVLQYCIKLYWYSIDLEIN